MLRRFVVLVFAVCGMHTNALCQQKEPRELQREPNALQLLARAVTAAGGDKVVFGVLNLTGLDRSAFIGGTTRPVWSCCWIKSTSEGALMPLCDSLGCSACLYCSFRFWADKLERLRNSSPPYRSRPAGPRQRPQAVSMLNQALVSPGGHLLSVPSRTIRRREMRLITFDTDVAGTVSSMVLGCSSSELMRAFPKAHVPCDE